jgi:hypothetical protein
MQIAIAMYLRPCLKDLMDIVLGLKIDPVALLVKVAGVPRFCTLQLLVGKRLQTV